MPKLDLFSGPPKLFIFEQNTNKSKCGCALTLIAAFFMIVISAAYIYEYIISEKYTYEAIQFQNYTLNMDEMEKILTEEKYKPNLTFDVSIEDDNFTVYKKVENNYSFPEKTKVDVFGRSHYIFNEKSNFIGVYIVYKCGKDEKCSSFYELIKSGKLYFGQIEVEYPMKIINHMAAVPISDDKEKKAAIISGSFTDDFDYYISRFEWEVIIYKDQKSLLDSLFGNNKEYIFGHFKNNRPEKEKRNLNVNKLNIEKIGDNYYLFATESLFSYNRNFEFLLYRRKKLSFFNVISNISAIFSFVNLVGSILVSLYSKNYDNFQMLKNILNPPAKPKTIIELRNTIQKMGGVGELGMFSNEQNQNSPLIQTLENNIRNTNDTNAQERIPPTITLQEIGCGSFVLNNFFCKCCGCVKKTQDRINLINNIIEKYMSYDLLLKNQILLENFFLDYNWNYKPLQYIQCNPIIDLLNSNAIT